MTDRIEQTADRVASALREAILDGDLLPGEPARDTQLAEKFGVSRTTAREATRILRSEGLLLYQKHRGVHVRTLKPADVREIFIVRRTLEIRAVEESGAASAASLELLAQARRRADAAVGVQDWRAVATLSLKFHAALVGLLDSSQINQFFRGIVAQIRLANAHATDEAEFQRPWIPREQSIHEAIVAGKRSEARDLVRLYLADAELFLLDVIHAHQASQR